MPSEVRHCPVCGTEFVSFTSKNKVCCSKSCARNLQTQQIEAGIRSPIQRKRKTGEIAACKQCGKPVYRKQWQIKGNTGLFCGNECRAAWQGRDSVTKPCEWCGKEFTLSPSASKRIRFCSWDCQTEGRSKTAINRWHNGRRVRKTNVGYILIYQPDHSRAYQDGWMLEHRWVAEQVLGRALGDDEHVHHINGTKDDNRPENLSVLSPLEHYLITVAENKARREAEKAELAEYRRRFGPL